MGIILDVLGNIGAVTDARNGGIFNAVKTGAQLLLARSNGMSNDLTGIAEPLLIVESGYFALSQMTILATGIEIFEVKNVVYLYLSGVLESTVNIFSTNRSGVNGKYL